MPTVAERKRTTAKPVTGAAKSGGARSGKAGSPAAGTGRPRVVAPGQKGARKNLPEGKFSSESSSGARGVSRSSGSRSGTGASGASASRVGSAERTGRPGSEPGRTPTGRPGAARLSGGRASIERATGAGPRGTSGRGPRGGGYRPLPPPGMGFGEDGAPGQRRTATERGVGGTQVEGRHAVRELLLAGRRGVKEILIVDGIEESASVFEILDLARELKVRTSTVSRDRLAAVARTEAPQGVVAFAKELPEADYDELLQPSKGKPPFLVAVDGVTDPQNLGALLRSAECAGVTGILLPRHRTVHVTPTVAKAAAGAVERLPIALVGGLPTALAQAKQAGAWIVGLDADGTTTIYELGHLATEAMIVVVGAEGAGLSRLVEARCDVVASIPLRGTLSSLNAAVAGAVALFEFGRLR